MAKEILGLITCPHCGNDKATVHKQAKGSRALYYRCYPENSKPCGTVQIILSGGQDWINKNIRPLNNIEKEIVAEQAAIEAKHSQNKSAEMLSNIMKKQKPEVKEQSGFMKFLTSDE